MHWAERKRIIYHLTRGTLRGGWLHQWISSHSLVIVRHHPASNQFDVWRVFQPGRPRSGSLKQMLPGPQANVLIFNMFYLRSTAAGRGAMNGSESAYNARPSRCHYSSQALSASMRSGVKVHTGERKRRQRLEPRQNEYTANDRCASLRNTTQTRQWRRSGIKYRLNRFRINYRWRSIWTPGEQLHVMWGRYRYVGTSRLWRWFYY